MNGSSPRFLPAVRPLLAGLVACLTASLAAASVPADAAGKAAIVGQPVALLVQPETIALSGGHAHQQLVVTGRYADGPSAT